jgi:hypothetical protein
MSFILSGELEIAVRRRCSPYTQSTWSAYVHTYVHTPVIQSTQLGVNTGLRVWKGYSVERKQRTREEGTEGKTMGIAHELQGLGRTRRASVLDSSFTPTAQTD